jgi:hypothetical protein
MGGSGTDSRVAIAQLTEVEGRSRQGWWEKKKKPDTSGKHYFPNFPEISP